MTSEKYITIKEIAELKGVSTRTIRLSKGKYQTREIIVKGGKINYIFYRKSRKSYNLLYTIRFY